MSNQLRLYGVDMGNEPDETAYMRVSAAAFMRAVLGGDEAYPPAYEDDDRIEFESITVCCVCGHAIEPQNQREYDACESLGVHLGECWHALKQDLARMPESKRLR